MAVPRGTRTIWRYLGALFILFTFAIGQMWAEELCSATLNGISSNANTTGIAQTGCTMKWNSVTSSGSDVVTIGSVSYYKFSGSSSYVQLVLSSGKFKAGDELTVTLCSNADSGKTKSVQYSLHSDSGNKSEAQNVGSATPSNVSYTLVAADIESDGSIKIFRGGNANIRFGSFSVTRSSGGGGGSDPVDPVFTYTPATYTIGDPALDLSTKLSSTNTTVAITFAVSTSDDGTTGASIASNKNFTATTAGTAKVTVSQAASTGYNAHSEDITVTVVEPDPCHKYFYFTKAADATTAGVTNNEGSFFTVSASGSNGTTGSITLDGTTYNCTNRTSNATTLATFTIPANKKGDLYGLLMSSGTGARGLLLDGVSTGVSCEGGTSELHNIEIDNIPSGAHTLTADGNTRVGMFIMKVCDATYHTITLDLDGGTGATSIAVLDGVPASKPADPTKDHCRFDGWYNGSDPYVWTANVTSNLTLTAHWTQLYTISFANGGGTGDAPAAIADKAQGETFEVPENTFTAPENKDFDKWNDGSADYAPGATYTVGTANVVLTAQWKASVDKYGVKFMDGSEMLDSLSVVLSEAPVFANPTKALYTFAGWKDGGDNDVTLSNLATTVKKKDSVVVLYAQWTKLYVSSLDFAAVTTAGTTASNPIATFLASGNMAATGLSNSAWETSTAKSGFVGYKLRDNGAQIKFNLQAGKRAVITLGSVAAAVNINAGDVVSVVLAAAGDDAETVVPAITAPTEDILVTLTTTSTGTVTLKSIVIDDIPALDDDATLSDLKVGGVTIDGFSSSVHTYYYELPYGTAVENIPAISATANSENAIQVAIQQAVWADEPYNCYRAQANVQAEDESWGYNDVRFSFGPKYGVELIKATHTGAKAATVTGYIGGTYDKSTQDNGKLGSNGHYFGIKLAEGNFQAGDFVEVKASVLEGGNTATMYTDKGETALISGAFDENFKVYRFTLTAETEWIYIYRQSSACNPRVQSIAVYRLMAPFIEEFAIEGVEDFEIDQENKTITASVASSFDVTALTPTVKYWGNGGGAINKTGAQNFTNPVTYTVSSAYAEDATGDYAPVTYTVTINKIAPSATPSITTQPQGANYLEGASITALSVAAESTAGELSYQWQIKNGEEWENIDGAEAASYTPAVSAIGSYTYRVVVTNTEESKPATSVNSEDATIVIAADPSCATFIEASIPAAEPYQYTNTGEWTIYNASSSGKRNGSDQVFTNVKDFEGNTVKGFAKERCVLIFEKDMKQIRFYSANAQRAWGDTPVRVSDDAETFLGTGTPSYNEYAATTSLIQADPSNNKEQIFIANGEFLAGKCYWFAFSGSLQIFQICAVEADPKADAPVFSGTLSDEAICPGNSFATLDATASPVTSYVWYKDDEVIENAEAATYTPTEAGTYYCIATNSAEGYRDNSTKSAEAVLSVKVATAITTAPANQRGEAGAEVTLSVVAAGANLEYAWYTCDDETGANPVAVPSATNASLQVTITASMHQYYKVVVTGDCGTEEAVALVEEWHEVAQADVTGSVTWDWNKTSNAAAWSGVANIQLSGADKTTDFVMANTSSTMPNNDNFRSDMLIVNGEYPARTSQDGGIFQGYAVKFHTTVPGKVVVTYRGTGNSDAVNLMINEWEAGSLANWQTKSIVVPAGDVVITEKANKVLRIREIVFDTNLVPAEAEESTLGGYEREVDPQYYGTICLPKAGVMAGATLFEVAYFDAEKGKVFFDEVLDKSLVAGRPYIFLTDEGNESIGVYYTATTEEPAGNYRGLYGTLADINEGLNAVGIYLVSRNQILHSTSPASTLKANRAYLKIGSGEGSVPTPATAPAPAPGRRRISMGVNGKGTATGIDAINASEKPMKIMIDGQIYILRGQKMYDATGRLVK